ncbi:MAG TPA: hypothetical protein VLJ59_19950 [Mycobacteriales bacterium]|nr:hypothetical protein [Mycobacteriales bacterium]
MQPLQIIFAGLAVLAFVALAGFLVARMSRVGPGYIATILIALAIFFKVLPAVLNELRVDNLAGTTQIISEPPLPAWQ